MGVLNITPDSFSDAGLYLDPRSAVRRTRQMLLEGADIIDIGGESSRPGAERVSLTEELDRVIPVVRAIRKAAIKTPLSIDTYKSGVARASLAEGVNLVNDITALRFDPNMAQVVAEFDAGLIIMHMKGNSKTMQKGPRYDDVIEQISSYLSESIAVAEREGIDPDKIVVDPGIGFGKTVEHNLTILRELRQFKLLGKPVLVGTSRKSFIGELTGKEVSDRTFGTAASIAAAIMNGVSIVRVHDIAQMRDVTRIVDAIKGV